LSRTARHGGTTRSAHSDAGGRTMTAHAGLERRILSALEATPSRIPVVLGGCGSGRTTALHDLVERIGQDRCQYIDVERAASTPERFYAAVIASSPFAAESTTEPPSSARDAFDRTVAFLTNARAEG